MVKPSLKVGIIEPTNLVKLSTLTGKPQEFFIDRAAEIGKALAESRCEQWVNSDGGMLAEVAQAYKRGGGSSLVVLSPANPEPWPIEHTRPYAESADHLRKEPNWFLANYNVVSLPDLCLCVGLSAGTLSELAYVKWNHQFQCGNLRRIIAIRELLRGGQLPPEIEIDIADMVTYVDQSENLLEILANH